MSLKKQLLELKKDFVPANVVRSGYPDPEHMLYANFNVILNFSSLSRYKERLALAFWRLSLARLVRPHTELNGDGKCEAK